MHRTDRTDCINRIAPTNRRRSRLAPTAALLALLLLWAVMTLPACARDPFEFTNRAFFDRFARRLDFAETVIHALDAYCYDGWYYYRVDHTYPSPVTGEPTRLTLVYFGEGAFDGYLNPAWEDFGDLLYRYEHYRVAEREGEHRAFTEEEIAAFTARYR